MPCTALQCTLHTAHAQRCNLKVHSVVHTAHLALHFTLCTVRCTLHTAHFTLCTSHCALYAAHCTLHTVHCTLHTAHCTPGLEARRPKLPPFFLPTGSCKSTSYSLRSQAVSHRADLGPGQLLGRRLLVRLVPLLLDIRESRDVVVDGVVGLGQAAVYLQASPVQVSLLTRTLYHQSQMSISWLNTLPLGQRKVYLMESKMLALKPQTWNDWQPVRVSA